MQKHLKLTVLGAMLLLGSALYANNEGKNNDSSVIPTEQVAEQKDSKLKRLCTSSTTFVKNTLKNKYTWAVVGLATVAGLGYYVYKVVNAEKAKQAMV